jgi:Lipoyl protein ligase A/B catalytic domain
VRLITGTAEQFEQQYSLNYIHEKNVSLQWALGSEYHLFSSFKRDGNSFNPTLLISTIDSPSVMVGRFQNPYASLTSQVWEKYPVLKRLSGGPSVFMGKGSLYMALLVPNYSKHLKGQSIRSVGKTMNDIMLSAFRKDGLSLSLASSSILTKKGFEIGGLGFEVSNDIAVWECWVGVSSPVKMPTELTNYPVISDDALVRESKALDEIVDVDKLPAWGKSFVDFVPGKFESSGIIAEEFSWSWLDKERINGLLSKMEVSSHNKSADNFVYSHLIEDYVGFVQAAIKTNDAGTIIESAKIFGDFLADSGGIELLQDKLQWTQVKKRTIALIIDDILGSQSHVIHGLKRLGSLLEAIMDAAGSEPETP